MKFLLLSFLMVILSFTSCKKEELDFKFSGTISSENNGLNLSNADVKIYANVPGSNNFELKGNTTSDNSGHYEISFERSKYESVRIIVNKTNYFEINTTYSIDDLKTSETNEINHTLSPKSWTRFILKKGAVSNSNDHIKIQKVSGKTNCDNCCPNDTQLYYGTEDLDVYCINDGDSYMKFYWWTIGSNTTNGTDSIYNTPFDTTSFTIVY